MLRILNIKNAVDYHKQSLTQGDYYTERGEMTGQWAGKSAELLGLKGEVNQKDFASVCENKHPKDQSQLTTRNTINRRQAYDFTFSVPKSVSIQQTITDDSRISDIVVESMQETMNEIEDSFQTRVRTNGSKDENRITGNLVYAYFLHKNSRPVDGYPDPHIHIHTIVMNLTYDELESKWKAGQFADKKANAPYYQAIFNSKVANKLIELGFQIRKTPNSFEIAQYDRPTIDLFSRRTKEIEAKIIELGITNDKAKDQLGARTRNNKNKNYTQNDLKQKYIEILGAQKVKEFQSLIPGQPIVIDADLFKKKHNDYQNDNHHIYGKMANELFFEALKIQSIPSVIFTGGGSGSGKSEIILKQLVIENYQGIIVDGTLANYTQAVDNINRSLENGKTVELRAIITDLERAYDFVLKREIATGRGVPLDTFLEKHFGFIESFPKLVNEFANNPKVKFILYDKRDKENEEKLVNKTKILDFFGGLDNNLEIIKAKLQEYEHKIQTNNRALPNLPQQNSITSFAQPQNIPTRTRAQHFAQSTEYRISDQQRQSFSQQNIGTIDERSDSQDNPGGRNISSNLIKQNQNIGVSEVFEISAEISSKQQIDSANFWINYNLEKNFERQSTISEQSLIAQTLMEGIGQTNLISVQNAVENLTKNGILVQDNLSVTEIGKLNNLSKNITTEVVLNQEKQLVEFVDSQKDKFTPFNFNYTLALSKNTFLNQNQKQVVQDVLNSNDGVIMIQGRAGTGKTTVLKEIEKGINTQGKQVLALAPTLKAVDILKQDFSNSATLQSFVNFDKNKSQKAERKLNLFDKFFGKKEVEAVNPVIDLNPPRGSIIIVDECSLVSTKEMLKLFSKSKLEGYRVILVGDSNQHKSVQRGNCVKLLEEHSKIESFSLTKILRQKTSQQIKAVGYLANGQTEKGLDQFHELGSIVEIKDDIERANQLAKVYKAEYKLNKIPPLVITPSHFDGELVSQAIRSELKTNAIVGIVGKNKQQNKQQVIPDQTFVVIQNLNLTEVEKQLIGNYQVDQIIQFKSNIGVFRRNDKFEVVIDSATHKIAMKDSQNQSYPIPTDFSKYFDVSIQKKISLTNGDWIEINRKAQILDSKGIKHNLYNGSTYQIKQITSTGQIQLSNDYLIPKSFQNYKYGYYSTSYSAQGQTVKTSLFYCSNYSKPAINKDLVYVSSSRFKNKHFMFVPDFQEFKFNASKGQIKSIGMDVKQQQPEQKPSFSQQQEPLIKPLPEISKKNEVKLKR